MADVALYLGVGNALRRDDGAGPWIAQQLAQAGLRAQIWEADGGGLIELFAGEPSLVLIDATHGSAPPGSITRFDAVATPLPRPLFRNSTHEFGLAEAVEIARRLGRLPARLEVIGIEGADFSHGDRMSEPVFLAARGLAKDLIRRDGQKT